MAGRKTAKEDYLCKKQNDKRSRVTAKLIADCGILRFIDLGVTSEKQSRHPSTSKAISKSQNPAIARPQKQSRNPKILQSLLHLFFLVIQADGGGHHCIGRCQYPAQERYKMHEIKYQAIAHGQPFAVADKRYALCRG